MQPINLTPIINELNKGGTGFKALRRQAESREFRRLLRHLDTLPIGSELCPAQLAKATDLSVDLIRFCLDCLTEIGLLHNDEQPDPPAAMKMAA